MSALLDRCMFRAASGGTGSFVVSTALTGYMTPAQADAVNSTVYSYFAESDDRSEWEIGVGTYTAGDTTLTRTPLKSSNSNAVVDFTAPPKVGITALAVDIREKLTANRTYYVRTDGNDSNNGLADSSGGAFLTIQKAIDVISGTLDIGTNTVTIQVGAGTYTAGVFLKQCVGAGDVIIVGDEVTPSNVTISTTGATCFRVTSLMTTLYRLRGMKLTATGAANLISADVQCKVVFRNIDFGSCASAQIISQLGALVEGEGNYTISGGAPQHVRAIAGVFRLPDAPTVTLTGTPAFSSAFVSAERTGVIIALATTFSGSATGVRYNAALNGAIAVGGSGGSYFPGNSAGTTTAGGQYA